LKTNTKFEQRVRKWKSTFALLKCDWILSKLSKNHLVNYTKSKHLKLTLIFSDKILLCIKLIMINSVTNNLLNLKMNLFQRKYKFNFWLIDPNYAKYSCHHLPQAQIQQILTVRNENISNNMANFRDSLINFTQA